MKKRLVAFAPNTLDELERILEERCAGTRGAMSDNAAEDALREVRLTKAQYAEEDRAWRDSWPRSWHEL